MMGIETPKLEAILRASNTYIVLLDSIRKFLLRRVYSAIYIRSFNFPQSHLHFISIRLHPVPRPRLQSHDGRVTEGRIPSEEPLGLLHPKAIRRPRMSQRSSMKSIAIAMWATFAISAAYATQTPVAGDAYVNSAYPSTNYGSLSNLFVNASGTALVQFNLSSLPAGTTSGQISKATVTLYVNRVNTPGLVNVQAVAGAWSESTVTYSSLPTLGSTVASFTPANAGQFITVDITSIVQSWVNAPATNFGIALTTTSADIVFDSKENDETSHVSALDITLASQGPQGIQGIQGPTGPTGAQGLQGAQGVQGPAGSNGATGTQGIQGAIGPTGATGATGAQGNIGATGATGTQGIQGTIGPTGATGATGAQGSTGATGAIGAQGIQGATGPTGATGLTYQGTYSNTTTYNKNDAVTLNGTGYIALQNSLLGINPATDSGTNWAILAAVGATGATGATGPQGNLGPGGNTGPTGATGATGPTGSANSSIYLTGFENPGAGAGTQFYLPPIGYTTLSSNGFQTLEAEAFAAPSACTMSNLSVVVNPMTPSGSDATTITVYHNLSLTTLSCTVTSNTAIATCTDTTHSFSVGLGDSIAIGFKETNANPFNAVTLQMQCQ
jgi:collagen triple helix repeat protein